MYCPVLESVGEGGSGVSDSESSVGWGSHSEVPLPRPTPRAGLVRQPGWAGGNSAPSEVVHSLRVSISGVRPQERARLDREWK